jgi:hypothetical protein
VARRLLIAFVLVAILTVACMYVLPKAHVDLPWFVPVLGYLVIVVGVLAPAIAQMPRRRAKTPEEEIRTPDPGPSPEDLERFGDPWLKLTDRRE